MDHVTLAEIGLKQLERSASDSEQKQAADQLKTWVRQVTMPASLPNQPSVTALEMTLNCSNCHSTKDRHRELFGHECAACHGTTQWAIAGFRHPSPRSLDCAQCHQAPPSHYMMHFDMISKRIARQEDAQVAAVLRPGSSEPVLSLPPDHILERHQRSGVLQASLMERRDVSRDGASQKEEPGRWTRLEGTRINLVPWLRPHVDLTY